MTTKNSRPTQGTGIEWTHVPGYKGETWNPVTGCAKVSDGCKNCYAERLFPRVYGKDREFTDVGVHNDRLETPLRWKKRRAIFVNSMSDLFHEKVPFEFIDKVLAVAALCPQHIFMVLTKRPERMAEYFNNEKYFNGGERHYHVHRTMENMCNLLKDWSRPALLDAADIPDSKWLVPPILSREVTVGYQGLSWPLPNLWPGVSIENQDTAELRIPPLMQCPAAVRFISYEPALGPVDFSRWLPCPFGGPDHCGNHDPTCCQCDSRRDNNNRLDWVIAGGESGPHARPSHPGWFREVRDQCALTRTPFFFKQWGEWGDESCGYDETKHKCFNWHEFDGGLFSYRVGKKAAGDFLDGKQWHQFPEVKNV